jgi:hypothetical protein
MSETGNDSSIWQKRIEGEWYGIPSVFDAAGNHTGWIKVARSSVHELDSTTYRMDTRFDNDGPLRYRFEFSKFDFKLNDDDKNRVYLGPDFIGAGHPYGSLVDAHYYSPAWKADLRTMVHILEDGETQVYSSMLFDGPTLCSVFNGVYKVAFDYETNEHTHRTIEDFCAKEKPAGRMPYTIPSKDSGTWVGVLKAYDTHQEFAGEIQVSISHEPTSLLRARQTITMTGLINRTVTYDRYHDGNHHTFDGPDLYGNGKAYGRALYTTQHFFGESIKITGRDFLYDDKLSLSACWRWLEGDRIRYMLYGELEWRPA